MPRIILVTGASRSGKSDHARKLGESLAGPRLFLATCPVVDEETAERIGRHQLERDITRWDTVEEPIEVAATVLNSRGYGVILIDCLTLWVNNLLYEAQGRGRTVTEDDMEAEAGELFAACRASEGTVILVTNEVGWGIVPDNRLSRLYRDLVGRCNRFMAERAHEVVLVVCGIPMVLKSSGEN